MQAKLSPAESFRLYGAFVAGLFLFFVCGLLVGRTPGAGQPVPAEASPVAVEDLKPELDFYRNLLPREERPVRPGSPASEARQIERPAVAGPAGDGLYTVQVAALASEAEARQVLLRLEARGYQPRLHRPVAGDRYFRVWVGTFRKASQARRLEARLSRDGFPTWLKKVQSAQ